jgi:hypothetical protein
LNSKKKKGLNQRKEASITKETLAIVQKWLTVNEIATERKLGLSNGCIIYCKAPA